MPHLSGYQSLSCLHRGRNCTVHRAIRESDQLPVIIKQPSSETPSTTAINRFEHEYELLRGLQIDGVITPLSLTSVDNHPTLVFPDEGAISLRQLLRQQTWCWDQLLPIAIKVSDLLGRLHGARIIHKKLSPDNILYLPDSGAVEFIDFALASRLTREQASWNTQSLQQDSLLYMAPEQTGRINRHIDYRSDFYSLGATLYELFTGQPPFNSTDSLQLLHSHIAKHPLPPQKVNHQLPEMLSRVILKLLAKDASQRYQSSFGLSQDLQRCLDYWHQQHDIPLFNIAQHDISEHFAIPQRLYGRAATIQKLRYSFDRAALQQQEIIFISGYAGVGKSSLVHELRHYIHEQNGRFISGKFDQFKRTRPYSAIFHALQGLIRQLLTENEQEILQYRHAIQTALGQNAQALVRLVPELELVIGKQDSTPRLSATEEQNRFSRMVQSLLQVFATPERPLLLFLDDLHWADLASFGLIETLAGSNTLPNLLVVGSYRETEVSAPHPLRRSIEQLKKTSCLLSEITLEALHQNQVVRLISDTLRCEPQKCAALAQICMEKTQGNPFFLIQFLYSLHDEGLIYFQQDGWQWNEAEIQSREMTDNVIDLMVSKIQKLSADGQQALQLAACIGSPFDLQTLASVLQCKPRVTADNLWGAVSEGLLIPLDNNYPISATHIPDNRRYRFVHDRIQQAAYSLIDDAQRQHLHLQIGRLLQQRFQPEHSDTPVFEIANHLNGARGLIRDQRELIELARLNCVAGMRALDSAAFDAALDYLQTGIELLPNDCWQADYPLSLSLYTSGVEAAYIKADFVLMNALADQVLSQAATLLDKVRIYEIRIQSHIARNQFEHAMQVALQVLQMLGVSLPSNPSNTRTWRGILRTQWLLHRHKREQILTASTMEDPHHLAALSILVSMFGATKFSSSNLRPLVMAKEVELTLNHGLTAHASMAFAGYGGILCGQYHAINQGYALGTLAMELDLRHPTRLVHHKTLSLFNTYVRHWKEPLANTLDSLLEGHQIALDCGDVEWGSYCLAAYIQYAFILGANFAELQPVLEKYTDALRQYGQKQSEQYSLLALQAIDNLCGNAAHPTQLFGNFFNQQLLERNRQEDHRTAISIYHYYSTVLCYLFNDFEQARWHSEAGTPYLPHIGGTYTAPCFQVFSALTQLAMLPGISILQQPHALKKIRTTLKRVKRWARYSPENHQHYALLLQAELHRVGKQYSKAINDYDEAIKLAERNGFPLIAAMANEMAGRSYLEWGKLNIARTYLSEAWSGFERLQASAKLKHLRELYPQLFAARRYKQAALSETADQPAPPDISNQHLDIISVIRSSQAISDEIVLEKLLERLMTLALESAGAQRAILILKQKNRLGIEAETVLDRTPRFFNNQPLDDSTILPVSVIHYVARTKENIVLSNAHRHEMFMQDNYLRQHKPRSLLCMPILYHGELTAILYLENNESRNVFDRTRMETLQILAAQAAISIENAKLYSSLEQSEQEYRSLFENTVEAIFRASAQGRFISANPALAELLGYPSPAHFLSAITDIGSQCFAQPEDLDRFLTELTADNRVISFETQWLRRDGSPVYVSISARRQLDEQGLTLYYEGSLSNITERKAKETAEQQQREAQIGREKAEAASQAKSGFLATMSHEIRTPMNGILGMTQLLQKGELSSEQQHQVQAIYQSGQSLLSILNDVLDFTKVEAGQVELVQAPFSVANVIDELVVMIKPMMQAKQLHLELNIAPDLPPLVSGDRRSLGQVLMNLCANAIKFTACGFIRINVNCATEQHRARILFAVEDSGIGIPDESHSRIFQHFSQADSSITRRYGGTGLGLAISKKIVELQQGNIGFSSAAGQGSRFWFEIPYPVPVTDAVEPITNQAAVGQPQPLRILLVEDTEINQQVARGLLESDGHEVDIAPDGYSALSLHAQHAYDLILMDIHLPDMDGMETTRRIRAHSDPLKANIRIIALTASITEAEINNYHAAGIDAVIGKPIQFNELQQLLGGQPLLTAPTACKVEPTDAETPPVKYLPQHQPSPPGQDSPPMPSDELLLDLQLIKQHSNLLGQDKFSQLIVQLTQQSEKLISAISQACNEQDSAAIEHYTHQLAGAAANFGLATLSQRCKELEQSSVVRPNASDELKHLLTHSLEQLHITLLKQTR